MKNLILKTVFTTLTISTLISCVNDDSYSVPKLECNETSMVKNMEVSEIQFTPLITQVSDENIVEAYVTSSDRDGNFFKSISFQTLDGSQAFSVSVDVNSTFINMEPGRKVLINLKDIYLHNNISGDGAGGKLIGSLYVSPTNGQVSIGRMPEAQFLKSLNRSCTIVDEDELVQEVDLFNLANDNNLNKLIELDNVQFDDTSIGNHYFESNNEIGGATNHVLTDKYGNTIIFRTSSYANFAHKLLPNGSGKVRGILTKYGTDYQFIVRYESDVMLDQTRFDLIPPFFYENFNLAINNTNFDFVGWTNFNESGTYKWREKTSTSGGVTNGYAEFSAYGGQALNVGWLITPPIDFTGATKKVVKFKVAQHHLDVNSPENNLEVYVSNDYNGTNVNTATWISLNANIPNKDTDWYEFLNSIIDVSSIPGNNLHFAFKFRGSGTNLALDGAFQVDDFQAIKN